MAYELEDSMKDLQNFSISLAREFDVIHNSIEYEGKLEIDPNIPVFVRVSDAMGLDVDLFDLSLTGEEANLRETVLAVRQILSEIDREAQGVF